MAVAIAVTATVMVVVTMAAMAMVTAAMTLSAVVWRRCEGVGKGCGGGASLAGGSDGSWPNGKQRQIGESCREGIGADGEGGAGDGEGG